MADTNRTPDEARPAFRTDDAETAPDLQRDGATTASDRTDDSYPADRTDRDLYAADRTDRDPYEADRTGEDAQDRTAAVATAAGHDERVAPVPAAPDDRAELEPASDAGPTPPKRRSNRLVGTAWVLLAAGLFQVVYFAAVAGLVALLAGPEVVGAQLAQYVTTPFAWLPVLFFFLLFELTVLIFNRAGRFLYVVASLIVGALVYVLSVVLITVLLRGGIGDPATLQQAFLSPLFVLTGLVAREVMLWTGVAIGARGTRLRKRNKAARESYRAELAEGRHA